MASPPLVVERHARHDSPHGLLNSYNWLYVSQGRGNRGLSPIVCGPVFVIMPSGDLHMRYTIRVNNVMWADDPLSREALAYLQEILNNPSPYFYRGRLESGMGLVSNNVLHDRAAFTDDATHKRHYYRARYFDRLQGTGIADIYTL